MARGFSQGRHALVAGSSHAELPWLLGVIKSCFKGQLLNFMSTLSVGDILVG
jgi:hypothetical protein